MPGNTTIFPQQGSQNGTTMDQQEINTGGMSTRGTVLQWGLRGRDFHPPPRPCDYETRDQRPQINIIPNGKRLG